MNEFLCCLPDDDAFYRWLNVLRFNLQEVDRLNRINVGINAHGLVEVACPDVLSCEASVKAIEHLEPSSIVLGYAVWLHKKGEQPQRYVAKAFCFQVAPMQPEIPPDRISRICEMKRIGLTQTQIIAIEWGAKRGNSKAYRDAVQQYKAIVDSHWKKQS